MTKRRATRVLMLLENYSFPDDTRVWLEASALRGGGYDVTVISPTGDASKSFCDLTRNGIRVYRYPRPLEIGGFVGYLWEFGYSLTAQFVLSLFVLLQHGFDVVHAHAPPDMFVVLGRFYQLFGKRFVYDQHDLSPELYRAQRAGEGSRSIHSALLWFERRACRSADRLIATNQSQRTVQIERGGAQPDRCFVVRNGPDERFLADVAPLPALRETGKTIIGFVGLMAVQDGVDYLIRSLASLRDELKRYDFLAVVVGSGSAVDDLKRLTHELELDDYVDFAGFKTGQDLLRYIASFDICVTPDPSNPYNDSCATIKTMEYMAMSKPTVAFDLLENRFTAGEAALYAPANVEKEMAENICRLMDDAHLRERMGQVGRRRIETKLAWQHQQIELLRLYDELTAKACPSTFVAESSAPIEAERVTPQPTNSASVSEIHA